MSTSAACHAEKVHVSKELTSQSRHSSGATRMQRVLVTLSYWASTLAEGASRIIIPIYFADIGISPINIGLTFLFYEAFGLLSNIYSGFFINRYGYKRSFLIALFLHTIASLGYLLLSPDQSLLIILMLVNILRACRGVGKELIKTTSSAYIKQLSASKPKAFSMPIQILLGGKDGVKGLGIILGGGLLTYLGFKLSFLVLGVLTLIFLVISQWWIDDYREKKHVPYGQFFKVDRKLSLLAWSRALLYAGRDFWLVIPIPLYLNGLGYSPVSIATILAVGLIISGLSQPLTADQVKKSWTVEGFVLKSKWRYRHVAIWSNMLLIVISATILAYHQYFTALLIAILLYYLIIGIAAMPHNYLHLKYARRKRASLDIAYYKTVSQIGKVIAVPMSGAIYNYYGIQGCLVASTVAIFMATLFTWLIGRRATKHSAVQACAEPRRSYARLAAAASFCLLVVGSGFIYQKTLHDNELRQVQSELADMRAVAEEARAGKAALGAVNEEFAAREAQLVPAEAAVQQGNERMGDLESSNAASSLIIYDSAQNVLTDEEIPALGWTSLNIIMREGAYEKSDGVFVKINNNVRFVPWLDLIADPLGQRFYSDAFIRAGELTLRVTKASCGGQLPLIFQIRELQPKVLPFGSTIKPTLADISYKPLSGWTESGLYLPDRLADHIDGRWEEQDCQSMTEPTGAALTADSDER